MWKKSSYSACSGNCVEVWRKSSYSSESFNCVEVALGPQVLVRDSKDPDGSVLAFAPQSWRNFLATVRNGVPR